MGCSTCEIKDLVDGVSVTVHVNISNLKKIAWSDELNSLLYCCPSCGSFWEAEAYSSRVIEVSIEYVENNYSLNNRNT